jgi:hypothetical protein
MKFLSQINVNTEYTLPIVDGTNGQVLSTDGNGFAYWGTISAGATNLNSLTDVIITSPQVDQILVYRTPLGEGVPVWMNVTSPYAPLASPTFTGVPTAPTAPTATNTTQIATTAFVKAQGYITSAEATNLYVPYDGAIADVDLGENTLLSRDIVVNHASGSGVAVSITKGGSGEALTVVKSSGSGNAASITGGVTLLTTLHLTNSLADSYISSAVNWNTAYGWGNHATAGYLTSYNESDTLQSVTSRGSSTSTDVSIGGVGGDRGLSIYHGSGVSDYGRIRFYQTSTNINTIHSFSTAWQSGNVLVSGGALNLTGNTGVTIGGWNDPDAVFRAGGGTYFRNSVGIGINNPQAPLDVNGAANATSFSSTALLITNADTSGSLQPDQGDPANKIYSFRWQGNEGGYIDTDNKITFSGFKTPAGTSSQFLKANGTVDSNTYLTTTSAASLYTSYDYVDDEIASVNTYVGDTFVPKTRTLTINGTAFDLSANRSWTISTTETDTLATVTARGNVSNTGIRNEGGHYTTLYENVLPAANNGGGAGLVQMAWWVSEPGITWSNGGFGYNVINDGAAPYGFGRRNSSFGQAYMRMSTSGDWFFYNANTSGVRVETMTLTSVGSVGIGRTSPLYKLDVAGNARFDNEIYTSGVWSTTYGPGSAGGHILFQDFSGNTRARIHTGAGVTSVGNRKLSLGILDINSQGTPEIKINTRIPFALASADFTVNIKGFQYGDSNMVSLSIGWHYYLSQFYNESAISNGSFSPTITLGVEAEGSNAGNVVIHLSNVGYWPKLYVESVHSSAYADDYVANWSWEDASADALTNSTVVPYKSLATSITGNAAYATNSGNSTTTSQTNFTTLTLSNNTVATQTWVQSQGYLTSLPAHTHTIANVTGLQTALDGKLSTSGKAADSELLDGVDESRFVYGNSNTRRGTNLISNWNQTDYPDVAFLSAENGGANAPTSDYTYGAQYSFHRSGAAYRTQLVTALYSDTSIYVRNSRDSDVWTSWKRLWHSGDFTSTDVSNWNTAYNDRISSATVTGTTTKTLTLTQGDGGTVTASWTDYDTDNDAQQLSYDPGANELTISNGNSIELTGLATEEFVTGQGYITGYTETDTLATVTGRGATTTNAITVGLLIAKGPGGNYDENIRLPGSTAVISFNTTGASGVGSYNIVSQTNFQIRNAEGAQVFVMNQSGDLTIGGTFTEQSSIRYKKDVVGIESTSDRVELLKPVRYKKIENEVEEIGLIAEDVAGLFPEVVKYDNEGRPDGVNYSRLSVILLKAVQELTERVNKLENK